MTRPLVLASSSPYKRELLARLGVPFLTAEPPYEEQHDLALGPEQLVQWLAQHKARSLAERYPGGLILGADQVAELDGELLFKPGTAPAAREQLARLSGTTHRLLTGVALYEPASGRLLQALDRHQMRMRSLTTAEIAAYVELDRPLDCAGSYKIEAAGIGLFESVRGDDFTAIIGLPLTRVVALLRRFGVTALFGAGC